MISVIMPVYNAEKFLHHSIPSILNQSYKNFEFIIFDDCSSDNSKDIIESYANKYSKIKFFRSDKNILISVAT